MKHLKNIKTRNSFSRPQLTIFIIAFSLIGYLIFKSFALNPNLPGDLNSDNSVNVTDLSILLSNYGTANSTADINSDGTVNILDMSILLSNYGKSYTPAATLALSSSSIQAGQTLSGTVSWTVTTTGSVASVEFWADNQKLATATASPYTYALDTTKLPNGTNSLGVAINGTDGSRITPQIGTVSVSNDTGTVTWNGDFETNSLSQYDSGTQCVPGQATVTTNASAVGGPSAARQGTYFFQSLTKSGDNIQNGERCEILKGGLNMVNGADQYYGWSVYIPKNLPTKGFTITGQFHGTYNFNQANAMFIIDSGQIGYNGASGTSQHWDLGVNGGSTDTAICPSGQYVNTACSHLYDLGLLSNWEGQWVNVALHIKWQDTNTGTIELWMKKTSDTGYTKYVSDVGNVSNLWQGYTAYLKLGLYRGLNTSLPDTYVWYDNVKQGTSFDSVTR